MKDLAKKIKAASDLFDVPEGWLLAMAWVESRLNPNARNDGSGAAGLFQFIPSTAEAYNINPYDVASACVAAARLLRDNAAYLEAHGIEATLTSVYLAHQQGATGCIQIYHAAEGKGTLTPRRVANMRANVGREIQLKDSHTDQELARMFILYWTGRVGQAEVEARKVTGG